jgi:hypothetical protein
MPINGINNTAALGSMGNLKSGATYIYESPDGGDTVYAREAGSTERVMIGQNTRAKSLMDQIQEDKLWGNIRRMSENDAGMAELLERVKIYYHLKKQS